MTFNMSRQVVIDDNDPRIQWTGDWFVRDSVGQVGRWSAPFLNTLHGFNGSSASLSFPYYGSGMLVTGSLTPGDRLGSAPATWQCLIDGVVINGSDRVDWSVTSDRLLYLCGPTPLLLKNHTLQLSLSGGAGMVWVDTIEYRVPTVADAGEEWTRVLPSDHSILYSDGWEGNDTLVWTYSHGAWLTYDFIGEGVTWSGHIFNESDAVPGLGYYTLDGQQPPKSFVIPATGSESLSNYAYINITGLQPGPHRLELRNGGNETTAALGFRSILTQNTLSPSFQPRKGPRTSGKTIGGVVGGGLCAVFLLIILAILIRRRRKRRQQPLPAAMDHRGSFRPGLEGRTAVTATLSSAEMAQRPPTAPPPTPGPRPPTAFSQDHNSASSPNSGHVPVQYTPGRGAVTTNDDPGIGAQAH